jgi:hypothetical protein
LLEARKKGGFMAMIRNIVYRGMAVVALGAISAVAQAAPNLLIIFSGSTPPTAQMVASGKFGSVTTFDAGAGTPTLGQLLAVDNIMAFTNTVPSNPSGLGDMLANAVDAGRHVTIFTYGQSLPWAITGRMQTTGYNPLKVATNADVSGNLVAVVPGDPVFLGVTLGAVTYFHNSNFAHPTLDAGATLLANDGAGVNMIARNANASVIGANLYPDATISGNNAMFFTLVANLALGQGVAVDHTIPTLSEWSLIGLSLLLAVTAVLLLRRRIA